MAVPTDRADVEKAQTTVQPTSDVENTQHRTQSPTSHQPHAVTQPRSRLRAFEDTLLKYNIEARGIQRVEDDEKHKTSVFAYFQVFVLWVSINLVVNNVTLGMLGPAVYGLSFTDASLCASFGALTGAIPVAWIATWGPLSGIRTMVFGRYAMGWWPSKLIVVLNIVQMLGYSLIVAIIGGQVLSAVSPNGSMSVVVGIIIIVVIVWLVTTFGIAVFHYYERFAWIPQLIVLSIGYGVSTKFFDLSYSSEGDAATVAGNRLSFFSICLSAAITYSPLAMDYFVYWSAATSRIGVFVGTLLGLWFSFTFALVLGIGMGSGIYSNPTLESAWTNEQGGSGSGALLVAAYSDIGSFGKFCAVIVALGGIANMIPPTYSAGVDFQILGRQFAKVPRVVWNTIGVIIYVACALAGRNNLAIIFTNFLALMGYWVAIWVAVLLEEFLIFRTHSTKNYDWNVWDNKTKLPIGVAAMIAFLVGWAGAILCMAQVWYIGPLARLVGEYGGDMGNYVGFGFASLVYPPLRWYEKRRLRR